MAIAYVNSGAGGVDTVAGTSISASAISAITGNFIVVSVRAYSIKDNFVSSVTDTAGNTYTKATSILQSGDGLELWYAYNITGNASNVITANLDGSYRYRYIIAAQYSGVYTGGDPLDVTATGGHAGGSASITSGTFTTTQADELVVASATIAQSNTSWTAGSGYTKRADSPQAVTSLEDKIVSSLLTNDTASYTNSSATESKSIVVATFVESFTTANTSNFFLMF